MVMKSLAWSQINGTLYSLCLQAKRSIMHYACIVSATIMHPTIAQKLCPMSNTDVAATNQHKRWLKDLFSIDTPFDELLTSPIELQ